MSILLRLFGINHSSEHSKTDVVSSAASLERERQEYRQTVQIVSSGARVVENSVINTWDDGLRLIARNNDG